MNKVLSIPSSGNSVFGYIDSANIKHALKFVSLLFGYLCLTIGVTILSGATGAYLMLVPLVIAMVYLSTTHPMKGLMCFFAFLSMEGMYRYLTKFAGYSYLLSPLMTGILVASFQFRGFLSFNKSRLMPYAGFFIFLLFVGFLAIFNPKGAGIYEGMATYSFWYLSPMLMYPLVYYVKKDKSDYSLFLITLIFISMFVSLVATIQYIQGDVWTYRSFPGSETANKMQLAYKNKYVFRPMAMSTIQGGSALWSSLGILPSFALLIRSEVKFYVRVLCLISMAISLYAVLISGSRSALMLSFIQIILFMLLGVNNMKNAIRTALIFLLMIGLFRASFVIAESSSEGFVTQRFEDVLSDPAATFQKERGANLSILVPMISENPFGIGYQRGTAGAGATLDKTNRETQFSALLADWGLVGMASMATLLLIFLRKMFQILKRKTMRSYYLAQISISWMLSYIIALFIAPILQANYFFWIMIAMSMNLDPTKKS